MCVFILTLQTSRPAETTRRSNFWDYETGEFEKTLKSHINAVNHVSYTRTGNLLASCSADLSIKLWNTKTYSVIRTLMGHDHNVSCVIFPDGKLFRVP